MLTSSLMSKYSWRLSHAFGGITGQHYYVCNVVWSTIYHSASCWCRIIFTPKLRVRYIYIYTSCILWITCTHSHRWGIFEEWYSRENPLLHCMRPLRCPLSEDYNVVVNVEQLNISWFHAQLLEDFWFQNLSATPPSHDGAPTPSRQVLLNPA